MSKLKNKTIKKVTKKAVSVYKKTRQLSFVNIKKAEKEYGGELLKGKRKSARPLSTKKPIHLVVRTSGQRVFQPGNKSLKRLIQNQATKFGVKIYDQALNWNHAHFVIMIKTKESYIRFIRSLTAIIAMKVSKSVSELKIDRSEIAEYEGGNKMEKLFELRPYTRIIEWGRQFKNVIRYQLINRLESAGVSRKILRFNWRSGLWLDRCT